MILQSHQGESLITTRPLIRKRQVATVVPSSISSSYSRVVGVPPPHLHPRYASTTSTTEEETSQGGLPPWLPSFLTAATGSYER